MKEVEGVEGVEGVEAEWALSWLKGVALALSRLRQVVLA